MENKQINKQTNSVMDQSTWAITYGPAVVKKCFADEEEEESIHSGGGH